MIKIKIILVFIVASLLTSCENMIKSDEIDNVISKNDIDIDLKIDADNEYQIQELLETENRDIYYLKIDVDDEFSIRGKADIEIGKKYKLSVTLKNISANPVIVYSFWKGHKTSTRNYTLAGKNGNPPKSITQDIYSEWATFDEYFEGQEGEDSFMIALISSNGTFYIKEIFIEEIKE
ncbi:hypothetical protein FNJ87_03585 [Nonlabens mediterrranea]|uniref:DUF4625 domain-containing protein n=1 Tax=Nonlabens mediterrranea TaxID=1419947 RepID=A0ABS0A242_9FLAO|nr:hypothetical protein [Nonlabens mediterrranea]